MFTLFLVSLYNQRKVGHAQIQDLPLKTETHRHFRTSKLISEPLRIFLQKYIISICIIFLTYIFYI